MNLIVKLHGTSGSGKTTVARGLMNMGHTRPILDQANRKPEAYEVTLPNCNSQLYVLGPYTATCGGLDGLGNVDDHIRLLETYAPLGHVFYEGLLGSEYYGRIGAVTEQYGDNHIFAFLDTPIEVCLKRIAERRAARGNTKPLDPSNTVGRVSKIEKLKFKLETSLSRRTVVINYIDPVSEVYNLYRDYDARNY